LFRKGTIRIVEEGRRRTEMIGERKGRVIFITNQKDVKIDRRNGGVISEVNRGSNRKLMK